MLNVDVIYFEKPGICGHMPDNSEILIGTNGFEKIENKLKKNNYNIDKLNDNWLCYK